MKLYNSLTNKLEEFVPIEEGKVKIYVCGPTVYNYIHLGNARPFTVFDVMRRYFIYKGYDVTYVLNITDIDDKIINRSIEEGVSVSEITSKYTEEFYKDAEALGIMKADHNPKATEHISEIVELIDILIAKGYAYEVDGDVYFDTLAYEGYGKLSKHKIEDLNVGSRIAVDERKRNATDFALWKANKPGEPYYESPYSKGRPGWHIECSAMSKKYLGETIDIHAGGEDLVFPHHENEIAQSEAANGKPFVRYWLHNGYINVDNVKMSKSLNNFFTVKDIANLHDLEAVRLFILNSHYRSPINYTIDLIKGSEQALKRLYNFSENLDYLLGSALEGENISNINQSLNDYRVRFEAAMDNDLNTAEALGIIFEMVKTYNSILTTESSKSDIMKVKELFISLTGVLGLIYKDKDSIDIEVEALIEKRQRARADKDFALADQIRDELKAMGIELKDTKTGVKWQRI